MAGREQTTHNTREASPSLIKNKRYKRSTACPADAGGQLWAGQRMGSPPPGVPLHQGWGKALLFMPSLENTPQCPSEPGSPRGAPAPPRGLGSSSQSCANSKGTILEGPARAQSSPWPPLPHSPPLQVREQRRHQHEEDSPPDTDPAAQTRTGSSTQGGEPREPRERHSGKPIYRWEMFEFSISVPRTKLRGFHPNAMVSTGCS